VTHRFLFSVLQSQRDCVLQPRVARNELPWVGRQTSPNPERVLPQTLNTHAADCGKGILRQFIGLLSLAQIIPLLAVLLLATGVSNSHAGTVVLDGRFGTSGPLSGPNFDITAGMGRTVGNNLFHSFSQFNLSAGDVATFSGPANIQNILARVTGGSASSIDGTIRSTINGANFFLINPAGIIFGANAAVDVTGSFAVSTANYLKLANGARFVAALGADDSVLTTDPVVAFGFLNGPAGSISIQGTLQVPEGKTLSVVGGDISVAGGHLLSANGQINLASAKAAGEVAINPVSGAVDAHSIGTQGRIDINNGATLDASGEGGGQITIRGGRLVIADQGTSVNADTLGGQNGRGIDIELTDGLELRNGAQMTTSTFGTGKGGDIMITAPSILLEGDSFDNTPRIASETFSSAAEGTGGSIIIHADSLTLNAAAEISTSTFGPANAGTIDITASALRLVGSDFALTQIMANANPLDPSGAGAGGDIVIHANSIEIDNGASLSALTTGAGDAGTIDIHTHSLTLRNGAISATTFFTGNGGAVRIQADTVTMDQANGLPSVIAALTSGGGLGGTITLDLTGALRLLNGSFISSETDGPSDGGSINIHAGSISLDKGSSIACSSPVDVGRAGEIFLQADHSILLNHNSFLSTSAPGSSGGNITVDAGSKIRILHSQITAEAGLDGGNISLTAPQLTYLLRGTITAQADTTGSGFGNGGNLTIDPSFLVLNNSSLISKSSFGNGGNINILTDYFFESASTIDASAPFGLPGTVRVTAPEIDLSGVLVALPENLLSAETQLRPDCGVRLSGNVSSFIVLGRGGLPIEPGGFLPSSPVRGDDDAN
jgi:filamentous hemagglutinin family protein